MSRFLSDALQSLRAYVPGEQPKDMAKLIKLNTNESPYPPSPALKSALDGAAVDQLRLYSDLSAAALTDALAEDLNVSPDQIMVGNGSDEVIYFAMLAFGAKGVQFADVTYGFYGVWAKLLGIAQRIHPLMPDFSIRASDYMGNDSMVVIANPNAPTGMALPLLEIERILRANPDQIVLIDEAYIDFGGQSAVSLTQQYENLIVCRTFSKSRQMAGARLGFAVGAPQVIADLNKIRFSINPYNVSTLAQIAGTASVRDAAYFDKTRQAVIRTRETAAKALREAGFTVLPSGANFVFARPNSLGGQAYTQALRAHGILVRWFDADRIRDFVRITIGTDEQMQTLIEVTKRVLEA